MGHVTRIGQLKVAPTYGRAPTQGGPAYGSWYDEELMRLGTRVWGVGKFLLLLGALGATFLISFGVSMRLALRAREVEVPKTTPDPISGKPLPTTMIQACEAVKVDVAL